MKLLKLLEHERKKKAKFSHAGLLVGPAAAHDYHHRTGTSYYGQRKEGPSLKRKRKQMQ